MDPDANLAEILRILARQEDRDFDRLVDLVEALHDWIQGGGALPRVWGHKGCAHTIELLVGALDEVSNCPHCRACGDAARDMVLIFRRT